MTRLWPESRCGGEIHSVPPSLRFRVSRWNLYDLTLTTYADYIPEQETENPLPEPVAAVAETNVVNLFG